MGRVTTPRRAVAVTVGLFLALALIVGVVRAFGQTWTLNGPCPAVPTGINAGAFCYRLDTFELAVWNGAVWTLLTQGGTTSFTSGSVIFAGAGGTLSQDNANLSYSSGVLTATRYRAGDGSEAAPSYAFSADPGSGFWRATASNIDVSLNGARRFRFGQGEFRLRSNGSLVWTVGDVDATIDLALERDAANILAQRNGTAAQTTRVYTTFTDASNFERLALSGTAGAGVALAAQTAGTGGDNLGITLTPAGTGDTRLTSGALRIAGDPTTRLAGSIFMAGAIQANLGTPDNGTMIYCSDCTIANPCAGGGTGALAKRLNGAWVCN